MFHKLTNLSFQGNLHNRAPTAAEAEAAAALEIKPLDQAKPPLVPAIPDGKGGEHHAHHISDAVVAAASTVGAAMRPSDGELLKMRPPEIVKCVESTENEINRL